MGLDIEKHAPAMHLASIMHQGQFRKGGTEPYINHPLRVARMVGDFGGTDDMINAALLHDVLEDTKCTYDMILVATNRNVADWAMGLSDFQTPAHGNRAVRLARTNNKLSHESSSVKTIKLADIIDNVRGILEADKKFAKIYVPEKRLQLGFLTAGNHDLWGMAYEIIEDAMEEIAIGIEHA